MRLQDYMRRRAGSLNAASCFACLEMCLLDTSVHEASAHLLLCCRLQLRPRVVTVGEDHRHLRAQRHASSTCSAPNASAGRCNSTALVVITYNVASNQANMALRCDARQQIPAGICMLHVAKVVSASRPELAPQGPAPREQHLKRSRCSSWHA